MIPVSKMAKINTRAHISFFAQIHIALLSPLYLLNTAHQHR